MAVKKNGINNKDSENKKGNWIVLVQGREKLEHWYCKFWKSRKMGGDKWGPTACIYEAIKHFHPMQPGCCAPHSAGADIYT